MSRLEVPTLREITVERKTFFLKTYIYISFTNLVLRFYIIQMYNKINTILLFCILYC